MNTATVVHSLRSEDLEVFLRALCREHGIRRIAPSPDRGPLRELAARVVEVVDWRAAPGLDALYDADAGLTDAEAFVTETNSLVLGMDATRTRGAFLVSPVHIAVVRRSQVLASLDEVWSDARAAQGLPTALVVVAGPSTTADIEGILITGVHGTKAVHVLLREDC